MTKCGRFRQSALSNLLEHTEEVAKKTSMLMLLDKSGIDIADECQ